MGKRKRGPVVLDEDPANNSGSGNGNGVGVAETLAALRTKDSATPSDGDAGEWQTVSNKRKKTVVTVDGKKVKSPHLHFAGGHLQSSVKISDLQALLLYCFSDGIAPNWISVRNSGHVKKAVVLMVPGLERGMFDGSLKKELADGGDVPEKSKLSGYERWLRGISPVPSTSFNPTPLEKDSLPSTLKPLAEVFPHVWPVKSPGDTKYNKVHSPLQAILLSALPKAKSDGKGPRPARGAASWNAERTPVTKFLLSVQDMKENEYVRHPAVFHDAAEKAANETLRKAAGQTAENGWVDTNVNEYGDGAVPDKEVQQGSMTAGREVLSLDCEMCITEGGNFDLARISLVGWDGEVMLDEFVKPQKPIIDYLTRFSGITQEKLDPISTTLADIQKKLLEILHPRTILIGHSLNSDLNAMQMTHPFIVDTAVAYPHPRGPPLKSSLKWLSQKYLGKEIQKGHNGHDSIEDARTTLDLIKMKCEKGERWGTGDQSSESIFARLSRSKKNVRPESSEAGAVGRTGALVDWGTPERGFGAQATIALGCKNDDDVVAGVNRVVNGDSIPEGENNIIPPGGVDFTWARLRELEIARGWCTRLPSQSNDNTSAAVPGPSASEPKPAPTESTIFDHAVTATVSHIQHIYESLPPCTLFIVYSGTADPRNVTKLQSMHRKYLEEFRSRVPWDQLSVKWTDTEEQMLKGAVEKAREGCAFMTVK